MRNSLIRTGLILAILAATPFDAETIAQSVPSDKDSIAAAVVSFHGALAQGDRAAVLSILAPDTIILESGGSQTRAEYEREHLGEDIAFARATTTTRSPLVIRQEGNCSWTTTATHTTGAFNGRKIDSIGAELIVLTRSESGWRIRAIHWSNKDSKKSG